MNKAIYKEINEIPVANITYDVIVVGAGIAGVSAALSAARKSCKVLLIEKSVMPGGLATLGLIAIYLPLCDGNGQKVIGGISEELLLASVKYGYDTLPKEWIHDTNSTKKTKKRYQTQFSPPEFIIAMEEKLAEAGVDILYDTVFSNVIIEDKRCTGIIVENKSGRTAYKCKTVVDASGDSDVFFKAGAKCEQQDNWLSYWWYETNLNAMKRANETGDIKHGIILKTSGCDNAGKGNPEGMRKFKGTEGKEVSEFIIKGREMLLERLKKRDRKKESFLTFPGMAQFRTTRRISGMYTLTEKDKGVRFEDSVGCAGDWREPGPIYEIPYSALISEKIENIIAAGRNISSSGDAWEVTRVIPVAAMTGEAAGVAAFLAINNSCALNDINVDEIQSILRENGLMIHSKETIDK